MKFTYYGYGFRFLSNYPLRGLSDKEYKLELDLIDIDINVVIDGKFQTGNIYSLQQNNDSFCLDLNSALYDIGKNAINVVAKHDELFYSTFYNIPLSILLVLHGRILLHSSAFVRNGELCPICASKGVGKSTLITYACRRGDKFFCDDTLPLILIKEKIFAVEGADFVKLNSDSCKQLMISNFDSLKKNINNKAYLNLQPYKKPIQLKKIYFMTKNNMNPKIAVINNKLWSKALILSSVVGISWFNQCLISLITNSEIYDTLCRDIVVAKLDITGKWDGMETNYLNLIRLIN